MKKLIIIVCCLLAGITSFSQSSINLDNLEYIEWRFDPFQGLLFRTTPNTGFQKMGAFKYKLRAHLKESDEAMKHFRRHNLNILASYGTATMTFFSTFALTAAVFNQANASELAALGSIVALSIGGSMIISNRIYQHLQRAIDAYNRSKNPNLSIIRPILPKIQPSRYTLGLGLVWTIS